MLRPPPAADLACGFRHVPGLTIMRALEAYIRSLVTEGCLLPQNVTASQRRPRRPIAAARARRTQGCVKQRERPHRKPPFRTDQGIDGGHTMVGRKPGILALAEMLPNPGPRHGGCRGCAQASRRRQRPCATGRCIRPAARPRSTRLPAVPASGGTRWQPCRASPCTSCCLAALASRCRTGLGRTLPAHELPATGLGELAPVVHEEAA
jgi:hypothetical protein